MFQHVDVVLTFATLAVAAMGVLMVYSATRGKLELAGADPRFYLKKQLIYAIIGGLPLIGCSDGRVRVFGILLGVAAVVSRLVFVYAFASVWCFFAAALTLHLCHALTQIAKPPLAA